MSEDMPVDKLVHDARGPLNSISMNTELAKMLLSKDSSNGRVQEVLDEVIRQCRLCNEVLENYRSQFKDKS